MSKQRRFRRDNTSGYDRNDLAALNAAWSEITGHGAPAEDSDDPAALSLLDHWAEQLLTAYARGRRGYGLTAWFYDDRCNPA